MFFSLSPAWAQKNKPPVSSRTARSGSQKGTVVVEQAQIYRDADFDAPIVGTVRKGQIFDISKYPIGPFYKIRLKPGVLGWVSDVDIRPTSQVAVPVTPQAAPSQPPANATVEPPSKQPEVKPKPRQRTKEEEEELKEMAHKPFLVRRYRGLALEMINWTENTMGATRSENMNFYGINWSGYNTAMSGEIYTDSSILFALSPPKYYEALTQNAAGGWILKMNFAFLTPSPQSPYYMLFYGFGPTFTYSHFDVALTESGKKVSYSLDDMSVGIFFNVGLAFKIGSLSPRLAFKYYIEKKQMTAGALNLGWEF